MFDALEAQSDPIAAETGGRDASRRTSPRVDLAFGIDVRSFDDLELTVVSKRTPGFNPGQVGVLRALLRDLASGKAAPCKFLAFDLSTTAGSGRPPAQFGAFVEELSDLIFRVPVLSIAWARRDVSGCDLELALACSMMVGEEGSRFGFDIDLVGGLRAYAMLAHRLGFVQAERLMEGGSVLSAAAAHELMLLHSIVPAEDGVEGIRAFARSRMRRHNSSCGLYRAQRIAMTGTT